MPSLRMQWDSLHRIAKGALIGVALGALVGGALFAFFAGAARDAEVLELGLWYAGIAGFPTSIALTWLLAGGSAGWLVFILVAPLLNGLLVGTLFGVLWSWIGRTAASRARQAQASNGA